MTPRISRATIAPCKGAVGRKKLLRKTLPHQKNEARAGGWLSGKVLFEAVAHTAYDQQNC